MLGGSGFLGNFVIESLVREGSFDEIVSVDLSPPMDAPERQHAANDKCVVLRFHVANVCEVAEVKLAIDGCECVLLLAALVETRSGPWHDARIHRANVGSVVAVLESCRASQSVRELVYMSSTGAICDGVWNDDLRATHGSGLASSYGRSKAEGERLVRAAHEPGKLSTVCVRAHVVFGLGDRLFTEVCAAAWRPLSSVHMHGGQRDRSAICMQAVLFDKQPPPLVGDGLRACTPCYVKNLADLLAYLPRRLALERSVPGSDSTTINAPPRIGGTALNVGDGHTSFRTFRSQLLGCRPKPLAQQSLALERLPLVVAWVIVAVLWLLDMLTLGRLNAKAFKFSPAALYYMAGANFAFELDGYNRAGFTPTYAFPEGVMRDVRSAAAAKTASGTAAPSKPKAQPPRVFAPIRLKSGLILRNKVIKEATFEAMCTDDGVPTTDLVRFHEAVARGGAALTTVAYASVSPDGRSFASQLLVSEAAMPRLRELTEAVHAAGGAAMVQLTHAGSFADRSVIGKQQMAPSVHFNPAGLNWPRAMTVSEIDRVIADFAQAAAIAVRCGFDAVQVHCGHGYLLSQSLSPATNRRTDEYGSSTVEGRTRLALRVCQAVREAVGPSVPIVVKMNLTDGFCGGVTLRDAIAFAQVLEASNLVDLLIPSGGWISRNGFYMLRGAVPIGEMALAQRKSAVKRWALRLLGWKLVPAIPYASAYFRDDARILKAHLRGTLPVCLLGGVDSLQVMHEALDDGFACVALARPILHEPDFVLRMQQSEAAGSAAVSGCTHCNLCIVGSAMAERPLKCTLTSSCLQW